MPAQNGWLRNLTRDPRTRSFGFGVGAALLGYFLWPRVKPHLRPVARGLVKGALLTAQQTGRVWAEAREGLEDLVAEARHEVTTGVAAGVALQEGERSLLSPGPVVPPMQRNAVEHGSLPTGAFDSPSPGAAGAAGAQEPSH